MSWIIRRIAALHPAMQGFLAFCLWNVLFVLGLLALENHRCRQILDRSRRHRHYERGKRGSAPVLARGMELD
jgi:hypothetical protein